MHVASNGLYVFRASRLEDLARELDSQVRNRHANPSAVLVPHHVIAANAGIASWLPLELARQRGAGSIVADVETLLPSTYYDRLAQRVIRESVVDFDSVSLRWSIYQLLESFGDPSLERYLTAGGESQRAVRKLDLAQRLASLYSQYMIYRPDWLDDWRDHPVPTLPAAGAEPSFVPQLWHRLAREQGEHRGDVLRHLTRKIGTLQSLPALFNESAAAPLHVFGVQHMPRIELQVLTAISSHRPVLLYVPDPSDVHWTGLNDLATDRKVALDAGDLEALESLDQELLTTGHPLIGAWGRLGQHFFMQLESAEVLVDTREPSDAVETRDAPGRLGAVQRSVRLADPELLRKYVAADQAIDKSLLVHSAYTPLRELEALRNALWSAFDEMKDLKPSDVLVVAPRMDAYLPLLPAVFGSGGRVEPGAIPYQVRGVSVRSSHPFFVGVERVISLVGQRVGVSQVLQLFESPWLMRRFEMDERAVGQMTDALIENGVAWGLSADDPEQPTRSLQWGIDRFVADYLMGGSVAQFDQAQVWTSPVSQQAVLDAVQSRDADVVTWLGALQVVVDVLQAWREKSAQVRSLADWSADFGVLIERLFAAVPSSDPMDPMRRWRKILSDMAVQSTQLNEPVPFSVARQLLLSALQSVDEQQPYLFGGVTFGNLAAFRGLPYKFIAVIGLNDGAFPRQASDKGLDLMRQFPRLGDRPYAMDDRYAFLETVMSARSRLHLSFLGRSERDDTERNPSLPLQDLMLELTATGEREHQVWFVKQPLQTWSSAYQAPSSDQLLEQWDPLPLQGPPSASQSILKTNVDLKAAMSHASTMPGQEVRLDALRRYYKNPLASLIRNAADALVEDRVESADVDTEPLDAEFAKIDVVERRVFKAMLRDPNADWSVAPDWLRFSGKFPTGQAGIRAWEQTYSNANSLIAAAHEYPDFRTGDWSSQDVEIDLALSAHALKGRIRDVYCGQSSDWIVRVNAKESTVVKDGDLKLSTMAEAFIDFACLRLTLPAERPVRMLVLALGGEHEFSHLWQGWCDTFEKPSTNRGAELDALRAKLLNLLEYYLLNLRSPRLFSGKISTTAQWRDEEKIAEAWVGNEYGKGERDYSNYNRLADGDGLFADGETENKGINEHVKSDAKQIFTWVTP